MEKTMGTERARARELVRAAHRTAAAGLVVSTSGNVSVRLFAERMAISGSGVRLAELEPGQISVCALGDLRHLEGAKPSIEAPLHRAIYLAREDVHAVLHFQALHATVLACAEKPDFDLNFIPEVPAYIRKVGVVPYFPPGSDELAAGVAEAAGDPGCGVLVLLNHGQIALGKDLEAAVRNAEFFELACRMACQRIALKRYDRETIEKLRSYGD
jgi:ribulose-5-phosphate 4-epimerase/fuculose-1-phosphate aldolase